MADQEEPQIEAGKTETPAGESPEAAGDDEVLIEELHEDELRADDEGEDREAAGGTSEMVDKIEEDKKSMSATDKLERSRQWKAEGNDHFKAGDLFKAADSYYHAILYCRDLTQNPQYYPKLGHSQEQRQLAKDLCESCFSNLAMVQLKYGSSLADDHPERHKVLSEAAKSAGEALKLNPKNIKALYRRAQAKAALARGAVENEEAQQLCVDAKTDLLAILQEEPQNRDARVELKNVQDHHKALKREEIKKEKQEFSFASTLSGVGAKAKDLLGDGTVKKELVSTGDGGKWVNEDWLQWDGATKCVVHMKLTLVSYGSDNVAAASPVSMSFILGDPEMHEGVHVAVKSMSLGEVARFTFAPNRLSASSSLTKLLPDHKNQTSVWELQFLKFVTWEDIDRDGSRLRKILNEGYGAFPESLAEVFVHWRVFGPDGAVLHSSRYTLNVGGEGGLKNVEDEDKPAPGSVLGESTWEPLAVLCRGLRQGGVAELRMRRLPELPKQDAEGDGGVSAQLSVMMSKAKGGQALHHCVVRAELERVVPPIAGPSDRRWEGVPSLVQERFRAEQLAAQGRDDAALFRLRRVVSWAEQLSAADQPAALGELSAARASIGWLLACRAAPVLDLGNVTSTVLAAARRDLAEAEEQCVWLEKHSPDFEGTRLLRAKILVAQEDDYAGAHQQLTEALRVAPNDRRVQDELKKVNVELRKQEEERCRVKVTEIRDGLQRARTTPEGPDRDATVTALLQQLAGTRVSWEIVMDTRIGVELKKCQEECGEEVKRLCLELLGRLKDETKEQRPMWER